MDSEAVALRGMQQKDIPAVHAIEEICFAMPWSERSIEHDLLENPVARWIVLVDSRDQVIAYAAVWLVIDEGHVCNIAVHPDWRGHGYGRRIVEALISLCKDEGMRLMTLEVRRSNLTAQSLYHSAGFRDVGYRKRYYEDNREDALIMFLDDLQSERSKE